MDSLSVRNHNRCAALDRPPHHEGREAARFGWKPLPVIPDDWDTLHLVGVIEHPKARGRIQNPLTRQHTHVDRTVDSLNPETGIGGVPPARAAEDDRLSVTQCDTYGLQGLPVSWALGFVGRRDLGPVELLAYNSERSGSDAEM